MKKAEALTLLEELGLPEHIIQHSIAVSEKAMEIAKQIQAAGHPIDLETVEIGALLHDIGRIKERGIPHAAAGGRILREHGLPEVIARIAETHSLNAFHPGSIEEKIVCYADKIIKGTQEMSVDDRFDIWMRRYGKSQLLISAKANVLKIEKELSELLTDG
ncbi:MAG: HDIG domain-containing protein [Candidatus Helarchaeota archaeon]|nr:HDIG domain-containing protein [Candidatus Helarchaeota archaeon]